MIVARVPSLSKPGQHYDVRRELYLDQEVLTCECPRFGFTWREVRGCRHTQIVSSAEEMIKKCKSSHGGNGLCLACLVGLLATMARKVKTQYRAKPIHPRKGGPMKTSLMVGTRVRYQYHGEWEYATVVMNGRQKAIQLMIKPPVGETVEQCIWKGDTLHRRRTVTVKE